MRILIVAPHPDDEVLGCGGTIAKYAERGDELNLCIVTKAYTPDWSEGFIRKRPREIARVNEILGIAKTSFLDFPTARLDTIPQKELIQAIANVVNEFKPSVLFIPHKGDLHRDHRLVCEASLVAARPATQRIRKVLSYETLSETEWGAAVVPFVPNVYVDISETYKQKKEALTAYESELRRDPHPRSLKVMAALAKKRGSEAGLERAEAFMLIREIEE
jgi:LmbE family N-acetylglucosaminyl deacetylase